MYGSSLCANLGLYCLLAPSLFGHEISINLLISANSLKESKLAYFPKMLHCLKLGLSAVDDEPWLNG